MNNEMAVVLGTVAMEPKGEYDSSTYYEKLNVVNYNNSTYMATQPSQGIAPTNSDFWQFISSSGLAESDVIDNLESTATNKPLSAKQGKVLNEKFRQYFKVNNTITKSELQNILNINDYKIIEFENGEYHFDGYFNLNKNTKLIFNNSTLVFDTRGGFYNFNSTDEILGYEGNGNIELIGGTIEGGHCSFCHAKNILFKDIDFVNCITNHFIEAAALNNVLFDNCSFNGVTSPDRDYVEYLQIDWMTRAAFPWFDSENNASYDGTTNKNIYINNCKFLKPENEDFEFYCGIGSHAYIEGKSHTNINITNCYFEHFFKHGIHLYNVDNVLIERCSFNEEVSDEDKNICILFEGSLINNVIIRNNKINAANKVISINAITNKNIFILDNEISGGTVSTTYAANVSMMTVAKSTENLHIIGNNITDFERKLFVFDGTELNKETLIFSNNIIRPNNDLSAHLIEIKVGKDINIADNIIETNITGGNYSDILLNSNVVKVIAKDNQFITNNRNLLNPYGYAGSCKGIKNISFLAANVDAATLTNQALTYPYSDFNKMRIILGTPANPIVLYAEPFRPMEKLSAAIYEIPFVYNGNVEIATITLNNDGTVSATTTNTNDIAFKGIRLSNE